jgi:hypothetical protein
MNASVQYSLHIGTLNPGKGYYARPFDSQGGVPEIFGYIALFILGYIVFRVWRGLKKH